MKAVTACLLFLLLLGTALTARAQFSIYAGPQLNTVRYWVRDKLQESESKIGFMAGLGYLVQVEGPAHFSPMIYFSRKGYKVNLTDGAYPPDPAAKNNNTVINTIELAPLPQVNFSASGSHGFVRFGPSFDFNIGGTETFDSTGNKRIRRDLVFDFGTYSHATVALNLHLGFQAANGLSVFAHYGHGLSSFNNADLGPRIFHRRGGLAVGWRLTKK